MIDLYGAVNASQTASWRPNPPYRGNYNILSTCLITIGLCVWTSLHLNIPGHNKASTQYWRKLKWLLVGLFAPELVAWTAFQQRRAASRLFKSMRMRFGQKVPVGFGQTLAELCGHGEKKRHKRASSRRCLWTMMHSHYAIMGGFAIFPGEDPTSLSCDRFLGSIDQLTITPDGLELLGSLDVDLIPNISESDINDKSKASGLGKAFVCIQAFWFCIQCVARLSCGLKISLLELNTFAHAICTLLIYFLWWDKPLDIEEPTLIQGESTLPAVALLCMASEFGRKHKTPQHYDAYVVPTFGRAPGALLGSKDQGDMTGTVKGPLYGRPVLYLGKELHGFYISQFHIPEYGDIDGESADTQAANPRADPIHLLLDRGQVRCLELASQAIDRYGVTTWDVYKKDGILQQFVLDRPQLSNFGKSFSKDSINFMLGLSLAGFVYGGLHLSAWNAPFPTARQQLLWRISGIVLASFGPAFILRLIVEHTTKKWFPYMAGCLECLVVCFVALPWYLAVGAAYIAYLVARIYLVVECFITLRHLPETVYLVPQWVQYIPHIS